MHTEWQPSASDNSPCSIEDVPCRKAQCVRGRQVYAGPLLVRAGGCHQLGQVADGCEKGRERGSDMRERGSDMFKCT